jgi:hypothetical protein
VSTTQKELKQSYERNQFFAGRLQDGVFRDMDWATIFLSPELINTELGSTLNITDQMFKSWSMGGQVYYHNFHYPRPPILPFNGKPILEEVKRRNHA